MTDRPSFVIYTQRYEEKSGGSLLLHHLCHYLNECGYPAYLWKWDKKLRKKTRRNWLSTMTYHVERLKHRLSMPGDKPSRRAFTSPLLNTPVASYQDLAKSIVIYPEVISGNPLYAKRVVRWFLNRPGFFTGHVEYGDDELHFHFRDQFRSPDHPSTEFRFFVSLKCFQKTNFGKRSGTCFILRKGKNRTIEHDLTNGIIIDELPNNEIAEVFNQCEYCISYDLHSAYSSYAALCGCKSIVVPDPQLTIEAWRKAEDSRWGVAYGEDDLDRAQETLPLLIERIKNDNENVLATVDQFAKSIIEHFH